MCVTIPCVSRAWVCVTYTHMSCIHVYTHVMYTCIHTLMLEWHMERIETHVMNTHIHNICLQRMNVCIHSHTHIHDMYTHTHALETHGMHRDTRHENTHIQNILIERNPPPGGFPIFYVPSSRTVCKRTPLEEPGTNPSRGVLLHTVLDEGT